MSEDRPDVVAVGLTGGIGAGKSTALSLFKEQGALTLSADRIVHELYLQRGLSDRVARHFGRDVLNERGLIDRARLAELVRGNPQELRWLEELTHPRVADRIRRSVRGAPRGAVVVAEVPLLFESGLNSLFDMIVTVEAGPETRRRRSIHGFDAVQFSELEGLQASTERRMRHSHLVFHNDGDMEALRVFVREAYARALALLEGS